MKDIKMAKKDELPKDGTPKVPLWKRALKSFVRMLVLFVLILGGIYWWNPQKVHYPRKKAPANFPRVDADTQKLFRKDTRVTIVVGHPDDAEFFVSGTLLKLDQAGAKLTLVVVTDGDKSYYPPFLTNPEENRKVRRQEQIDASAGYHAKVVFLGGPDGRYDPDEPTLRAKLKAAIDESKPDYLMTFDSEYVPTIQHRDHENSGRATTELAPQTSAKWLLLFATNAKNYFVDTEKFWSERTRLVAIHKSQFYGEKLPAITGMLYQKEIDDGAESGYEMAEGFRAVKLKD